MDPGAGNRWVVLAAVAVLGAVGGQYLLNNRPSAPAQPQVIYLASPGSQDGIASADEIEPDRPTLTPRRNRPSARKATVRLAGHRDARDLPEDEIPADDEIVPDPRSSIVPVAAVVAPAAALPLAVLGAEPTRTIIRYIEDDGVLWSGATAQVSKTTVRVYLETSQDPSHRITVNGDFELKGTATLAETRVLDTLYGPYEVTLKDLKKRNAPLTVTVNGSESPAVALRFPDTSVNAPAGIGAITNRLVQRPTPVTDSLNAHERFLELSGTAETSTVEMIVCRRSEVRGLTGFYEPIQVPGATVSVNSAKQWKQAVDLSAVRGKDARVLVRSVTNELNYKFAPPLAVVLADPTPLSRDAVRILSVTQKDEDAKPASRAPLRFNSLTVKVTATVPTSKALPDGMAVLVVEGADIPATLKPLDDKAEFEVEYTAPAAAAYRLAVKICQGSKVVTSDETRIEIQTTGPRPIGISPENLALTPGLDEIEVIFDKDIQPAVVGSFTIVPTPTPAPTVMSTVKNRVRLKLSGLPPNSYTLTVAHSEAAPIRDLFGNSLSSKPGSSGGSAPFTLTFLKPVGAELSTTRPAGVTGMTGPFVPYPEFTAPRPSSAGFNPSDKVVTRVSRLYYFRDAHRVVQIIQRDGARSYNRQAVTMQQQLADTARRDAENAAANRQAAERSAVQSAQKARAAETALNQFQQALVTARNQQAVQDTNVARVRMAATQRQRDADDAAVESSRLSDAMAALPAESEERERLKPQLDAARTAATNANRKAQDSRQELTDAQSAQTRAADEVRQIESQINGLLSEVQVRRNEELQTREEMVKLQTVEDQKQKEAFRREVAAATEDPDTYSPGDPLSIDPVKQVSLSVIGEGLIQMRGPLKGINLVRTMINEIDAPVGQVKVAIHTVQVNGEHGARMEPVIGRIQRYIDHSRFLTTQSGQMLRNAVTTVASRRAEMALAGCEAGTQAERDQKYLEAFFGIEFLHELHSIHSEFLNTGNKLLSLHSMDSTSLANALFLLALAKNDVREEILREFEKNVGCKLPSDEMEYFLASNEKTKFGPPLHKSKFVFLGQNARFVSFRGFFDVEVQGSDTLTPLQREFVRLAQIFKSRLVTELEWQQRVMERSLIEDRLMALDADGTEVVRKEKAANDALDEARRESFQSQAEISKSLTVFLDEVEVTIAQVNQASQSNVKSTQGESEGDIITILAEDYWTRLDGLVKNLKSATVDELSRINDQKELERRWTFYDLDVYEDFDYWVTPDKKIHTRDRSLKDPAEFKASTVFRSIVKDRFLELNERWRVYAKFKHSGASGREMDVSRQLLDLLAKEITQGPWLSSSVDTSVVDYEVVLTLHKVRLMLERVATTIISTMEKVKADANEILLGVDIDFDSDKIRESHQNWRALHEFLKAKIVDRDLLKTLEVRSAQVYTGFAKLFDHRTQERVARRIAESSRRPLDHKKFLDMLIDDVEDKFIELMEGTRAHTANIDNYLSRLGQALEDDFNTQFYFPAFKGVREASRYWDVQLGAIESTSVLTNNRTFAKVSPQATMEFDLPKRDILINEAFRSAQAAYDDYGALLGDPTFLSLAKLYRGQPPSATFGSGGGTPTTRNVLPGLPSSSDEKLVAQARAVAPDFPSALESLIPDPAVYKFETGTGFEVRPVIQPDGQAVVFHLNYMYTTNVREPIRADEKHLGRVKRHFIDTDVQTGNYEMREVSRYQVALKASRTSRGVPLLEDVPVAGVLFRPLPSQESSIQENLILAQSVIYPTLFDLMGLRWAPAVADLDALRLQEADFVTRNRQRALRNRVFDFSSQQVDEKMRIEPAERRTDLYRSQESIPSVHPNGYSGPGLGIRDATLREEYQPEQTYPPTQYYPGQNRFGARPYGDSRIMPQYEPSPYGTLREMPLPGEVIPPDQPYSDQPPKPIVPPSPAANPPAGASRPSSGRTSDAAHLPMTPWPSYSEGDRQAPPQTSQPPQGLAPPPTAMPGPPRGPVNSRSVTDPVPPSPAPADPQSRRTPIGEPPADIGFSPATPAGPAVRLDRDSVRKSNPLTGGLPFGERSAEPKVELESSSSKRRVGLLPSWSSRPAPAQPAPTRKARP